MAHVPALATVSVPVVSACTVPRASGVLSRVRLPAEVEEGALWTNKDPSAVAQWLTALPAGPFRDAAVGTYVNKVAVSSPNEAARWANVLHQQQ